MNADSAVVNACGDVDDFLIKVIHAIHCWVLFVYCDTNRPTCVIATVTVICHCLAGLIASSLHVGLVVCVLTA